MARQLDLDRMRRRVQLVRDAEAARIAREQAAALYATPFGRALVDIAAAIGRALLPHQERILRSVVEVPDLRINVQAPPINVQVPPINVQVRPINVQVPPIDAAE